jgi:hypothetical protein
LYFDIWHYPIRAGGDFMQQYHKPFSLTACMQTGR